MDRPGPIETSGRAIKASGAVLCCHWLVEGGGHTWESWTPHLSFLALTVRPAINPDPLLRAMPSRREKKSGCESLCSKATSQIVEQRENGRVENGVRGDGDAQEPAKRPHKRLAGLRGEEFGQFQTG
jgi:hypothetical protein